MPSSCDLDRYGSTPRALVELAARHRLPAIYESRLFVDAGGLVSTAPAHRDVLPAARLSTRFSRGEPGRAAHGAADEVRALHQPKAVKRSICRAADLLLRSNEMV